MNSSRSKMLRKAVVLAVADARAEYQSLKKKQRNKTIDEALSDKHYPYLLRRIYRQTKRWWTMMPTTMRERICSTGDKGFAGILFVISRDVRATLHLEEVK